MGTFQEIGDFLLSITPSFRKARRIRNKIKTHHRKNIRNLQSEGPVQTFVGKETAWLSNKIERQHMDLESRYHNYGRRASRRAARVKSDAPGEFYFIDDEEAKEELIADTEKLISQIETMNTRSKIKEVLFYFCVLAVMFLTVTVASGTITPG